MTPKQTPTYESLTNVELLEVATEALAEYERRTGKTTPQAVLKFIGTELLRMREAMRAAVMGARATAEYVEWLRSLGPDDDTPEADCRARHAVKR